MFSSGVRMFTDPLATTMAMQMLFFVGLVVVFFFLARAISAQGEETREALRKQQMYLDDLERRLMDMSFLLRRLPGGEDVNPAAEPARTRNALSPAGRKENLPPMPPGKAGGRASDDLLLPPPLSARAAADSYDPEKDPFLFEDDFGPPSGRDAYAGKSAGDGVRDAGLRLPPARRDGRR
ncbi:MAG: hypothetical protein LBP38_02680 [Desulfovibrio sp.]|jgi:hypothetical protein|nr:hypothetical protein [Desulfovibrio sp.]